VRITALETLRPAPQPNLLLVQLHTDDGLVGLGEAFLGAGAVEAYLHDTAARSCSAWTIPPRNGPPGCSRRTSAIRAAAPRPGATAR
jgi:L-alanine-DL-glutamate epimerase-like enolase superfamily enzyme